MRGGVLLSLPQNRRLQTTLAQAWLSHLGAPIESLEVIITVPSRFFGAFEQVLRHVHPSGIESVEVTD